MKDFTGTDLVVKNMAGIENWIRVGNNYQNRHKN